MPYNKGDFTQQGINGDVSALVRLNDKRVVKMVLSSDDESSNVDVTGTVYDYLNGETYPLGGSTPTGTITITENGTGIDVAQYALADVNVSGGSGIPTCEITVVLSGGADPQISLFTDTLSYRLVNNGLVAVQSPILTETTLTCPYMNFDPFYLASLYVAPASTIAATDAVNCTWNSDDYIIMVTDPTRSSSITLTGYTPK